MKLYFNFLLANMSVAHCFMDVVRSRHFFNFLVKLTKYW